MSAGRLLSNHEAFVRDLLRDYCAVFLTVAEQLSRYRRDGSISYTVFRALIGESQNKGVFWRLKDTAHHLFRNGAGPDGAGIPEPCAGAGRLVDWCIGYAFHECCKLREDAFQGQHYAARLDQLIHADPEASRYAAPLMPLVGQTAESSKRELNRILHVLRSGMLLLVRFLPAAADNCCLARWLATEQSRVRRVFQNLYPALIRALYGSAPSRMNTLAAVDFLDCGRQDEARRLLERAREQGLLDEDGERMLLAMESPAREQV